MTKSSLDKYPFEVSLTNRLAQETLSAGQLRLWNHYRSTHRVYLKQDDSLCIWTYESGAPNIVARLFVTALTASLTKGLTMALSHEQQFIDVGHAPVHLPDLDTFLWVPTFSEIRWAPADYESAHGKFRCTAPLCIKQKKNKDKELVEGVQYVSTAKELSLMWPGQKIAY